MTSNVSLNLTSLQGTFAVCKTTPNSTLPRWASGPFEESFWSVTVAGDELSVVTDEQAVPYEQSEIEGWVVERGWMGVVVNGTMEFSMCGIMANLSQILATAEIPILALSTFDTDYIFVKHDKFENAKTALRRGGHIVDGSAQFASSNL